MSFCGYWGTIPNLQMPTPPTPHTWLAIHQCHGEERGAPDPETKLQRGRLVSSHLSLVVGCSPYIGTWEVIRCKAKNAPPSAACGRWGWLSPTKPKRLFPELSDFAALLNDFCEVVGAIACQFIRQQRADPATRRKYNGLKAVFPRTTVLGAIRSPATTSLGNTSLSKLYSSSRSAGLFPWQVSRLRIASPHESHHKSA